MKLLCILGFLLHSIPAEEMDYYRIDWLNNKIEVGEVISLEDSYEIDFSCRAYIFRHITSSDNESFCYLVAPCLELNKRKEVVDFLIYLVEENITTKEDSRDFKISYMRESYNNLTLNFRRKFPNGKKQTLPLKRSFMLKEFNGEKLFVQVPITDIVFRKVEDIFILQYNRRVYILREEIEQKSEIAVQTELREEINNNMKIVEIFAQFFLYNEGCETVLLSRKFEKWPVDVLKQMWPYNVNTNSENMIHKSMSFEMIKVRVIWYSPNDESFREEYRPITEMHTNIFTEVDYIIFHTIFQDIFVYIKPTPADLKNLHIIKQLLKMAEELVPHSTISIEFSIINDKYMPITFLSLFADLRQRLLLEENYIEKTEFIKNKLQFF